MGREWAKKTQEEDGKEYCGIVYNPGASLGGTATCISLIVQYLHICCCSVLAGVSVIIAQWVHSSVRYATRIPGYVILPDNHGMHDM